MKEFLIEKIIKEYNTHGNILIGADFDDTIKATCREFEPLCAEVRETLKECGEMGLSICLYTICTSWQEYEKKIKYCADEGIKLRYFNYTPVLSDQPHNFKYKAFFNILLDDKAGLEYSLDVLKEVLNRIKK